MIALRTRKGARAALGIFLAWAVTGCASFDGQPEPVVSVATADGLLNKYPIDTVHSGYSALSGAAQRDYRNEVIYAYIQAIDARYFAFRAALASQRKGGDLGFDGLLLGLGAIGSLWTGAAEEALIGTTAVTGARGAVDRNLYYEQTLTALLAAMDAERFRLAAAIHQKMNRDTGQYPLGAALADIQAYQLAGTLESAASHLAQTAANDRQEAKVEFDRTFRFACSPKADLTAQTAKLRNAVMPIARAARAERDAGGDETRERDKLARMAPLFEVDPDQSVEQIALGITDALNRDYCSLERLQNLGEQLKKDFPNEPSMGGL